MREIELGDKVKCIYSGFTGTVVAKTEFINGCIQFSITPVHPKSKMFIPPEPIDIDSQSLKVISKKRKKKVEQEETGGASGKSSRMRGF